MSKEVWYMSLSPKGIEDASPISRNRYQFPNYFVCFGTRLIADDDLPAKKEKKKKMKPWLAPRLNSLLLLLQLLMPLPSPSVPSSIFLIKLFFFFFFFKTSNFNRYFDFLFFLSSGITPFELSAFYRREGGGKERGPLEPQNCYRLSLCSIQLIFAVRYWIVFRIRLFNSTFFQYYNFKGG